MNTGSRPCWTSACAASAASSSASIRAAAAGVSRRWRRPVAGARRSTGGSSVSLASWSSRRRNALPQVNAGTILLLLVAILGGAWAAGLCRPRYEDGRLTLQVLRSGRVLATFDLRDTGLLLLLALVMGWAVAAAVEKSQWVPGTEGRLVPALSIATVLGWIFIVAGFPPIAYFVAPPFPPLAFLLWFSPSPLTGGHPSFPGLSRWLQALPDQTTLHV